MNQPNLKSSSWNPELYDQKHSFVWKYGAPVVESLAAERGERILDLGCGTGELTATIAQSGAQVIGLDNSAAMLTEARQKHPQIEFVQADAHDFQFSDPFDAIFSNAVLHWISEPSKVVRCIAAALKPGGRLVVEFGGAGNVKLLINAIHTAALETTGLAIDHPWYYPTIGDFAQVLENNGLETTSAALIERPTQLDGDDGLRNWIRMFGQCWLNAIPIARRDQFFARAEELSRDQLLRDEIWYADYRRLRAVAVRT